MKKSTGKKKILPENPDPIWKELRERRGSSKSESIGGDAYKSRAGGEFREESAQVMGRSSGNRGGSQSESLFLPTAFKVYTALVTLLLGIVLFLPLQEIYTQTLTMANEREQTFIMVKPDGVQRGLVGEIIKRFEQKGFKLVAMKFMWADEKLLQNHYADLSSRPFFAGLIKYMRAGPVCPMVWEGLNVVKTGRQMLGETDPAKSLPGTIRGDYCIQVGRNIIHGSDAVDSAKKEINLWFKPEELIKWKSNEDPWLYE